MSEQTTQPDLIDRLECEVADLAVRGDELTADQLLLLREKLIGVMRRAKSALEQVDDFMIVWMPAHQPEIVVGDVTYYIAPDKKVKDRNVAVTAVALLSAVGGDEQAFCDCLSTNAFKPGAAKRVLGDQFDNFFETTYGDKLAVQSVNKKFLKGGQAA